MSTVDNEVVAGPVANRVRLPMSGPLAFAVCGFLAIMTETLPAARCRRSAPACGCRRGRPVNCSPRTPSVPWSRRSRWSRRPGAGKRRPLLLTAIAGLLVFNAITAVSTDYAVTLASRFVAGMAAGVVWGLLAGYARRMVPRRVQGRAVAVVGVGRPIALSVGVPPGAWLGALFDRRDVFWLMSGVAWCCCCGCASPCPTSRGRPCASGAGSPACSGRPASGRSSW